MKKLKFTGIAATATVTAVAIASVAGADIPGLSDSQHAKLGGNEISHYSVFSNAASRRSALTPTTSSDRVAIIKASVPATTQDLLPTTLVRKSPVSGADVFLSAGTNGSACLQVAGNGTEPGAEACFDLARSTDGDGSWLVNMSDGQWRLQGIVRDGTHDVVVTTHDGKQQPVAVVANLAIVGLTGHPAKVQWTDADGKTHEHQFGNPNI